MNGEREYFNLSGPVEDEHEHDEPVELAQALGEWAAAHHQAEPKDEPRTLVPYSGGDSTGTRFIYPGWYERDAGRAHPGRTYVTEVSVPKLGDGGTQRLHSQMLGEPDREREAGI